MSRLCVDIVGYPRHSNGFLDSTAYVSEQLTLTLVMASLSFSNLWSHA